MRTRFQISPHGDYVSYLAPWKSRLNIFTLKLDTREEKQVTYESERNIAGYFWASNQHIVFLKDKGGDENYHLFSANVEGLVQRDLTPFDGITVQLIDELPETDDEVIIGMNRRNNEIFDAYRLNVVSGELTLEAENPGNITSWITDHDGVIRIAIVTDGVNQSLLHRQTKNDLFQTIVSTDFRESVEPLFFTFNNQSVYALSNLQRDRMAVVLLDLQTGKEKEVLFQNDEVDIASLAFSRKRKVLTDYSYISWKRVIVFLDDEAEKIYKRLEAKLPDLEIFITSQNKEETRFLVRTHSDRSLGSYYLYDRIADQVQHLADVSPWLKPEMLSAMKPIKYSSRDGLTIHGYLTLHAEKIKAPLLVAQGRNDPRVNINESDQMVAALKKKGVDVEYLIKDNEGHGFQNEENRFEFYRAMEKFLAEHLKE